MSKVYASFKVHVLVEESKQGHGKQQGAKQQGGWLGKGTIAAATGLSKVAKIINFWCFNPGFGMEQLLNTQVRSVILTSGTLAPLKPLIAELAIPVAQHLENPHIVDQSQVYVKIIGTGPDRVRVSGQKKQKRTHKKRNVSPPPNTRNNFRLASICRATIFYSVIFLLCANRNLSPPRERARTHTHTHSQSALSFALPPRCIGENDRQTRLAVGPTDRTTVAIAVPLSLVGLYRGVVAYTHSHTYFCTLAPRHCCCIAVVHSCASSSLVRLSSLRILLCCRAITTQHYRSQSSNDLMPFCVFLVWPRSAKSVGPYRGDSEKPSEGVTINGFVVELTEFVIIDVKYLLTLLGDLYVCCTFNLECH